MRKVDLVLLARPAMEALRTQLDETCHLMVRIQRDVRFLASVEADQPLRVSSRAGAVLPAHQVSGGKLLLAELSMDESPSCIPKREYPRRLWTRAQ